MATQTAQYYWTKDNGDGTASPVTSGTVTARVIRASDGYEYDSVSSAFVASGATATSMTESAVTGGLYQATFTVTAWNAGLYLLIIYGTSATYGPFTSTQPWTIAGGVAVTAPGAPVAASTCRCYLYLSDTPSTAPTSTVEYAYIENSGGATYAAAITPVYSSGTGLWYADCIYGSTVRFLIASYGIGLTAYVPPVTTALITTMREV